MKALGMARTAEVKRDARIGEAEAKRDAQIKEAIAEEERMASRLLNDAEIAKSKRDFELKKAAYDVEVHTKVSGIILAEIKCGISISKVSFLSLCFPESRGRAGVRAPGSQDQAEDQRRADANQGGREDARDSGSGASLGRRRESAITLFLSSQEIT